MKDPRLNDFEKNKHADENNVEDLQTTVLNHNILLTSMPCSRVAKPI